MYVAGATQAIALAYDMIQVGRAERVVVIAGDNASSDTLMPWLGNGFRALGAATTQSDVLYHQIFITLLFVSNMFLHVINRLNLQPCHLIAKEVE